MKNKWTNIINPQTGIETILPRREVREELNRNYGLTGIGLKRAMESRKIRSMLYYEIQ